MARQYFKIPEPCSEDWNKMTPTEQGAFCAKCTKEVINFEESSLSEIASAMSAKEKPCVRMAQNQIEYINFSIWFGKLSLKKRIKYIFLFAFLFVFQFDGKAQGQDSTLVSSTDTTLVPTDSLEHTETISDSIAIKPVIITADILDIQRDIIMGIPPLDPVQDLNWDELTISCTSHSLVDTAPLFHPDISTINLGKNEYSFYILEDELHFLTKANQKTFITLRIQKTDESDEAIYFSPMAINPGNKELTISLDDFENGDYSITIENDANVGSTVISYW